MIGELVSEVPTARERLRNLRKHSESQIHKEAVAAVTQFVVTEAIKAPGPVQFIDVIPEFKFTLPPVVLHFH